MIDLIEGAYCVATDGAAVAFSIVGLAVDDRRSDSGLEVRMRAITADDNTVILSPN